MPKVKPEHEKARRKQILESALACFMNRGYHTTTIDDIVAACGLSKGAIYTYFPSKSDLFQAAAEFFNEQRMLQAQSMFSETDTAFTKLEKLADMFLGADRAESGKDCVLELEFRSEAIKNDAFRKKLLASHEMWHGLLMSIINEGIEAGELRPDIDPTAVATILVSAVEGLFLDCGIWGVWPHWQEIRDAFVKMVQHGILKDPDLEQSSSATAGL